MSRTLLFCVVCLACDGTPNHPPDAGRLHLEIHVEPQQTFYAIGDEVVFEPRLTDDGAPVELGDVEWRITEGDQEQTRTTHTLSLVLARGGWTSVRACALGACGEAGVLVSDSSDVELEVARPRSGEILYDTSLLPLRVRATGPPDARMRIVVLVEGATVWESTAPSGQWVEHELTLPPGLVRVAVLASDGGGAPVNRELDVLSDVSSIPPDTIYQVLARITRGFGTWDAAAPLPAAVTIAELVAAVLPALDLSDLGVPSVLGWLALSDIVVEAPFLRIPYSESAPERGRLAIRAGLALSVNGALVSGELVASVLEVRSFYFEGLPRVSVVDWQASFDDPLVMEALENDPDLRSAIEGRLELIGATALERGRDAVMNALYDGAAAPLEATDAPIGEPAVVRSSRAEGWAQCDTWPCRYWNLELAATIPVPLMIPRVPIQGWTEGWWAGVSMPTAFLQDIGVLLWAQGGFDLQTSMGVARASLPPALVEREDGSLIMRLGQIELDLLSDGGPRPIAARIEQELGAAVPERLGATFVGEPTISIWSGDFRPLTDADAALAQAAIRTAWADVCVRFCPTFSIPVPVPSTTALATQFPEASIPTIRAETLSLDASFLTRDVAWLRAP